MLIDDSANELLCFLVWPLQRQQSALLCNCLVGALRYSHYVMRSFSLCGVRFLHSAQYGLLDNIIVTADEKKKRCPGCLAHAVIGMFYSVVANQRQPQYIMFYSVGANRGQLLHVYFCGGGVWGGWGWGRRLRRDGHGAITCVTFFSYCSSTVVPVCVSAVPVCAL